MTRRQILTVLGALMISMLLAALDQTIVGTALPTIVVSCTVSSTTPGWSRPPADGDRLDAGGRISDLYGRKIVFQAAIVIFLIASVLAGLSQNMGQLIAFRALQALAAACCRQPPTIVADVVALENAVGTSATSAPSGASLVSLGRCSAASSSTI